VCVLFVTLERSACSLSRSRGAWRVALRRLVPARGAETLSSADLGVSSKY